MGFSMRAANAGASARTVMPIATGRMMIAATSMIFCTGGGTYWPSPRKNRNERSRITGSVTRHSTLLMAVRVMLSATSPRARWL